MARRSKRSSSRAGSSSNQRTVLYVIGGIAVIALLIYFVPALLKSNQDDTVIGDDLPGSTVTTRASQLTHGKYTIIGKVLERYPSGDAEILAVEYKGKDRRSYIIPVQVPPAARSGININTGDEYRISLTVKDSTPTLRGICVADSVNHI